MILSGNRSVSLVTVLLLATSMLGGLTACAPPPKPGAGNHAPQIGGPGKAILNVENVKQRPPFRTVNVNGAEMLEARGEIGKFGGTFYTSALGDGPKTFNPLASFDATSSTMAGMMFSGLTTTDAYTGDVIPYLAKEVKMQPDKMTYIVTLRKGLQWSDGKPLTSKDVVFTWNEIIKPGLGNPSTRDGLLVEGKFPDVKAIDDLTIEFKTAKPFSPFLRNLGTAIMPEHILKPVVYKGNQAFSNFWGPADAVKSPDKFVGNGMWLLERYENRQRIVFKRNPLFFMVDKKGQRLPYLDRYVYTIASDLNNEELQFEQGKSDSYGVPGNFLSHVRELKKPNFKLYNLGPTSSSTFMAINLNTRKGDDGKALVDPVKARWFNDVNFRQAINHAIHRDDMVANILKGVGAPLYTAEALSSIFLDEALAKGFPTDLNASKDLLKKSGFTWDAKGKLHDKAGHQVRFTMLTNSGNTDREATGVNIKQDLDALGITVDFKPIEFNVLVDKLRDGSYETMVMGLTGDKLEPHSGANVWKSDGAIHLFNQRHPGANGKTDISDRLPWEKQLDEIFEKGAQTFGLTPRKQVYDQYQQIIYDEAPLVYLYSPLTIVAVQDRIKNFDPTPLDTFHNLEEIWIDQGK